MKVAVVIPIYKPDISPSEKKALLQCIKVLGRHPLVLIKPRSLDASVYFAIHRNFIVKNFDDIHFASIDGYNALMLHPKFYFRFLRWNYLLIYQLDAFVFKDELDYWCSKKFDYIGAPWLGLLWPEKLRNELSTSKYAIINQLKKLFNFDRRQSHLAGNGGFSLRKSSSFFIISCLLWALQPIVDFKRNKWNEDVVWSIWIPKYFPFFAIAPFEKALMFGFESDPDRCYELNNHHLPFGCHGWEKFGGNVWDKFIPK